MIGVLLLTINEDGVFLLGHGKILYLEFSLYRDYPTLRGKCLGVDSFHKRINCKVLPHLKDILINQDKGFSVI